MATGVNYTGLARNQDHRQWLDTLLDRHALRSVGTTGSAIYSEELALQVATHFLDVVDFLKVQDATPDDELSDDNGEAAA